MAFIKKIRHRLYDDMKNRLKDLRTQKAWSQARLAEHLNVSRQTVNAIETQRYDPSLPLAFTIARLFDCQIEDIFIDEGSSVEGIEKAAQ